MSKEKKVNFVGVQFDNNSKTYYFKVPDGITIEKDEYVVVKNTNGKEAIAKAIFVSFELEADSLKKAFGVDPKAWVVGRIEKKLFTDEQEATEPEKPKAWWEGTQFDVKAGEKYFHVGNAGCVLPSIAEREMITAKARWAFGNACKDEAYVERRAKEIKLYNLLSNFAEVVNEGWRPDWRNHKESKFSVVWNEYADQWDTYGWTSTETPNAVYFKTRELAQRAIAEIILPFERGEL